ncbi:MAG: GTPase Era [Bacteroidetes bacterium]|nr:GTPase Era [Bacteroidota bacterium]
MHKSGFVNIIGKPNVGKSTLMNALVGEKLSIITPKAQTTRHRIRGIVNGDDFQIVFSDTPGIITPHYKLHEAMMNVVSEAISDAEVILFVLEIGDPNPADEKTLAILQKTETPVLVVINKIDLGNQDILVLKVEELRKILPKAEMIPVSAIRKFNCDHLLKRIIELIPEAPPYFSKDDITDKSQRFFISEIIREKIFFTYQKEIPYSTEVIIEEFHEDAPLRDATKGNGKITRIRAVIFVMRKSQMGILIGHGGKALKIVGSEARKDIEEFLEKKVFLEMIVKVEKDWRDDEKRLKRFGYIE